MYYVLLQYRHLTRSNLTIKDIAYHDKLSTLYWVTAEGVYRNSNTGRSRVFRLTGLNPTGLALDRATDNLYVSGMETGTIGHDRSVIKVILSKTQQYVNVVTTQTAITDLVIDSTRGLLFFCEHLKPRAGRIIRSTMDGSSTNWLYKISKIVYPVALTLDPIQSRVYWADLTLQSISSSDYNGQQQKLVVSITNGQPLSITFFENRISWTNVGQSAIRSQMLDSHITATHVLHERISHILTAHAVLEPELRNPCASATCGNGLCLLRDNATSTCMCPQHEKVLSSSPSLVCSVTQANTTKSTSDGVGVNPDEVEIPSSPGVTVASILICLAILTILAILGWVYYKRWRQTIGSPLKLRFRSALGMSEESTAWEESVDYSDRKMLYQKNADDDDCGGPQVVIDQNDNRPCAPNRQPSLNVYDTVYASQQSLGKQPSTQQPAIITTTNEEHQPPPFLPVSYSMKEQLLRASEL